jgi:hypothetical protein
MNRRSFLTVTAATLASAALPPESAWPQVPQTSLLPRVVRWMEWNRHVYSNVAGDTWARNTPGIPKSFEVLRANAQAVWNSTEDTLEGAIERMILNRGISVYDGAIAQLNWMLCGDLEKSRALHATYSKELSPSVFLTLRGEYRQNDPSRPFRYSEDDRGKLPSGKGWLFRLWSDVWAQIDPKTGTPITWMDWKPIAGENAWAALASVHLFTKRRQDELSLARELADIALLMQVPDASTNGMPVPSGAIRYAPLGTFGPNFYEVSTENCLSWLATFRMLHEVTGERKYLDALLGIERYLYDTAWNRERQVFVQGFHYDPARKRWIPNDRFAADCQSWAVLVLGPERLDQWFGAATAVSLLYKLFSEAGVESGEGANRELRGIDFSNYRQLGREAMVSVEWTAGAIMAARRVARYVRNNRDQTTADRLLALADSMHRYLLSTRVERGDMVAFPYATGKAAAGKRSAQRFTGFGWFAPVEEVMSLASTGWMALLEMDFNPFFLDGQRM